MSDGGPDRRLSYRSPADDRPPAGADRHVAGAAIGGTIALLLGAVPFAAITHWWWPPEAQVRPTRVVGTGLTVVAVAGWVSLSYLWRSRSGRLFATGLVVGLATGTTLAAIWMLRL